MLFFYKVRKFSYIYKILTLKPNNYETYSKSSKCSDAKQE